jgi:CrcB protein
MKEMLLVGLGGFAGSVARYTLSTWVTSLASQNRAAPLALPLGTWTVNILGCFIIGVLSGLAVRKGGWSAEARLLLFTGLLGGFTTFSAFGLETVALLKQKSWGGAVANVGVSLLGGLLAVWAGTQIAEPPRSRTPEPPRASVR